MAFAVVSILAAGLLVAAGLPKLTSGAARTDTGLPGWVPTGAVLGVVEVGVGLLVLLTGSTAALALLAMLYLSFTAVSAHQYRAGVADCGCFGTQPVRPSGLHVVLNAVLTLGAVATVFVGWPTMSTAVTLGVTFLSVVGGYVLSALMGEAAEISRLVGESEAARAR
ncbi:MAG: MauE/DoxX family redox-associated membrane protein [Microthrixaceae bacterium]